VARLRSFLRRPSNSSEKGRYFWVASQAKVVQQGEEDRGRRHFRGDSVLQVNAV